MDDKYYAAFTSGYEKGRSVAMNLTFTKEQFLKIANIAEDGESIPLFALFASSLREITEEDKVWARSILSETE